jgi:glutamate carboxypeptidase
MKTLTKPLCGGVAVLTGLLLVAAPTTLQAQGLSQVEQQIVQYVDAHSEDAIALLERIVNINSGTGNHEGVREVGRVLRAEFDALGFATEWISLPETNRAGHLFAERDGGPGKTVLLIGHLDTVFEQDSPFQQWQRDSDIAKGPGVEDMKGGDVVMLYALNALEAAGVLDELNIIVAYTGDEEDTGDPLETSRRDLIEVAERADVALGFEGGVGSMHSATIARRGYTDWYLEVTGARAHSSLIFGDHYGAGAINETARILNAFYKELKGEEYLTFGPGIILGGTATTYDTAQARGTAFGKTNVIPQTVTVAGDLRTLTFEQRDRTKESMQKIVSRNLPRTSATLTYRDSYPPMAPTAGNQQLFETLDQVSSDMGFGPIEAIDPGRRGAADISFAAPHVDAALAGLGPFGDGGHTPDEEVDLRSIAVATKRAAALIYRIAKEREGA